MKVGGVVVHVPHASVAVPQELRQGLLLSDRDLVVELVRMTDAFTDELFLEAVANAQAVVFPVSRLLADPERLRRMRTLLGERTGRPGPGHAGRGPWCSAR